MLSVLTLLLPPCTDDPSHVAFVLPEANRAEAAVARDVVTLIGEKATVLDGCRTWSVTASVGVVLVGERPAGDAARPGRRRLAVP